LAVAGFCLLSPLPASALDLQHESERPPIVQIVPGSTVDDVTESPQFVSDRSIILIKGTNEHPSGYTVDNS
jgi:hypothetical protein